MRPAAPSCPLLLLSRLPLSRAMLSKVMLSSVLLSVAATVAACHRDPDAPAAAAAGADPAPTPTAAAIAGTDALATTPAARRIAADLRTLADDRHAGRLTGTPGFDGAAQEVADRFKAAGLQPAGDDGTFFQRVPLLRSVRVREGAALVVHRNGRDIALRFGEQFLPAPGFLAESATVTAPAVFVNQGLVAPAQGVDDFAGVDLHGRIAVLFRGAPDAFDDAQRRLASDLDDTLQRLAERGAVGAVLVNTAMDEARAPWAGVAAAWERPAMRLRGEDGRPLDKPTGLKVVASVSASAVDLVFADLDRSAAELAIAARAGRGRPQPLPGTITLSARSRITPMASRNVVAMRPGADPALRAQAMVYSAHLDHLGTGAAVGGDAIYNGAVDNALGVAILLETARTLAAGDPLPRTQLFLATTGEEQGLLGARWFAAHPGDARPVADLNLDMPVLTAPTADVVAIGDAQSSLQAPLAAAAARLGVVVSPDPFPEDDAYVRSDQYAFVRAGVPSVYLTGGVVATDADRDPAMAMRYYLRNCYHRPCDDASLPIRYDDAARMAGVAAAFGRAVSAAAGPPRWNDGDPFGRRFAD